MNSDAGLKSKLKEQKAYFDNLCKSHWKNKYITLGDLVNLALEHVPQKCMRFCDENMLQHIESGASSFAERDSTFGERALARKSASQLSFRNHGKNLESLFSKMTAIGASGKHLLMS